MSSMRRVVGDSGWDAFVGAHPHAHILQTAAWGALKARFGWQAETVRSPSGRSGALVLFRRLPLGLTLGYIPRGPVADWNDRDDLAALAARLDEACRARGAFCLKWEPDLPDTTACTERLAALGLRPSPHGVQPRRSLVVSLDGAEADVLGRMKQKTRYNIGLAAKKGVAVRAAESAADVETFTRLMAVTGARDGFATHAPEYYRAAFELFHPLGQCALLLAEYQGEALAGVMAFAHGRWSWYFYGASSDRERSRMAPYAAQWAAMQWARQQGALTYDLWGVPDEDEAALEAEFQHRRDGLWGVYRFKRGFGGRLVRTVGAWDRVYNPLTYALYRAYVQIRGIGLG